MDHGEWSPGHGTRKRLATQHECPWEITAKSQHGFDNGATAPSRRVGLLAKGRGMFAGEGASLKSLGTIIVEEPRQIRKDVVLNPDKSQRGSPSVIYPG